MRLANTAVDECRRRVQNDTLGHRGSLSTSPTMAVERVSEGGRERLRGLLAAGDPFVHYRIRALLYTGRPSWDLLATITR